MKLIIAIIQPDKLEAVRTALVENEVFRITVNRCTGRGQQVDKDLYRGQEVAPDLIPKVRLDVAVNDDFVERTIDAILQAAKHGDGKIGDGKIFVVPLEQCIRIRTAERGSDAI